MNCLSLPHDLTVIVGASAVCLVSMFGVFRIRGRLRTAQGKVRLVWLFLGGVEAGAGIWGGQFLALTAMSPGGASGFAPLATIATLLAAVTGAVISLGVAWSGREKLRRALGGVLFAFTIAGVHYAALGAQHLQAAPRWEPILVWLSMVSGVALCVAAVLLGGGARRRRAQLAGAGLLAAAVVSVHLIGMGALTLVPEAQPAPLPPGLLDRTALLFAACLLSVIMIAGGLGAVYIDDSSSRRAVARIQRLANAAREGIAVLGEDRRVVDCNSAFAGLCGRSPADLVGAPFARLLQLDDDAAPRLDLRQEGHVLGAEGRRTPVACTLHFVAEHGEDGRPQLIATVIDLSEQRAAEAHIRFLNEHDALTGLPNREVLVEKLTAAADGLARSEGRTLALMCVRVTNSQEINTLHGHAAGDALLAKVGERLKRFATPEAAAARLGGNEFALFAFGESGDEQAGRADAFFARLMQVLGRPFVWNAHVIEPQVKVGVAAIPQDSETVADLFMHAESALHAHEDASGVGYFRRELHEARNARRVLAQDLRTAIAEDQLTVFYQPQARSEDGSLCGFEALVRWTHPVHGFLPPDRFIGVAEENGLIGALGEWVLRRACLDAAAWPKPVPVAVNLSPLQVGEPGLPARVHEILLETGLSPGRLELEITESALFRDYQRALDVLRRLKALGVRIAMDDFGTGFSSLSTLQSFPFDKIKIDKSFVEGVGKLERSTVIVKAVLGIGRGLAIPVVAEGVETAEQMAFLRDELCAAVQGYHIGRPGPVELHEAMFRGTVDEQDGRQAA